MPTAYARRPAGSVDDSPNAINLTVVRNLDQPFNVAGDLVRLDWLDNMQTDGVTVEPDVSKWVRYTIFGFATTVPGKGNLAGYAPSVVAPGWWPDILMSGLMHAGTAFQQDCFINTGNRPYWWPGLLQTIDRTKPPGPSRWCCFHEGTDEDDHAPGIQVGNESYGCIVIMPPPDKRYKQFAVFRNTIRVLLARRKLTTFGYALLEVRAGDPLLQPVR